MEPSDVDSIEYNFVITKLREFCRSRGLIEACVQQRRSILAACEDPETVSVYNHGGEVWPLPQTGQMQLETEILHRPQYKGFFTTSTSYRNEPDPVPGRHDLIFPMFEFEFKGGIEDLIQFEADLLRYVGFKIPENLENMKDRGKWLDVANHFNVKDITHDIEMKIQEEFGNVFFLTHFPSCTSPFWNMKQSESDPDIALKVDVIIHGMETIGSAERATNVETMSHQFKTISNGGYARLLYSLFGNKRVKKELEQYLSNTFYQRCGGGIGLTRLMRAMRLENLFKY